MSNTQKINAQTFETRWGYVAYSHEDYCNLKRLNIIFQKARINAARWERWVRKAPHNRVKKTWIRNEKNQKTGYIIDGFLPEPITCDLFSKKLVDVNRKPVKFWFGIWIKTDNNVELEYRKSRKPSSHSFGVENAKWTSSEINKMLNDAESWIQSLSGV